MNDKERLLRWYPLAWRARYGDEFEALIDDMIGDGRPARRLRVSIVWAGLRERAHASGLRGDIASPAERTQIGGLLVLWAWTVFVIAGLVFAKRSEHAGGDHLLTVIAVIAGVAQVVVVAALILALPSVLRFLRTGGWSEVASRLRRAIALTVAAGMATIGLIAWAHSIPGGQREAGAFPYGLGFLAWVVIVVAALTSWTAAAFAIGRRTQLDHRVLAIEVPLAGTVAAAMLAMTAATIVWWANLAEPAPAQMAAIVAGMIATDAAACYGITRLRLRPWLR